MIEDVEGFKPQLQVPLTVFRNWDVLDNAGVTVKEVGPVESRKGKASIVAKREGLFRFNESKNDRNKKL